MFKRYVTVIFKNRKSTLQEVNLVIKLEYKNSGSLPKAGCLWYLSELPSLLSPNHLPPPPRTTKYRHFHVQRSKVLTSGEEGFFAVKDSFLKMKDPPLVKAAVIKATDLSTK